MKSIAYQYRFSQKYMTVSEVRGSNKAISTMFDVVRFPVLVMVCGTTKTNQLVFEKFEKDVNKYADVQEFIESFVSDSNKCSKLEKKFIARRNKDRLALESIRNMREQEREKELRRKKTTELISISRLLGIDTSAFAEKEMFVHGIIEHFRSVDAKEDL